MGWDRFSVGNRLQETYPNQIVRKHPITGDHSNQDPRYTQKPIYYTIFAKHIWSWLLCSPVIVLIWLLVPWLKKQAFDGREYYSSSPRWNYPKVEVEHDDTEYWRSLQLLYKYQVAVCRLHTSTSPFHSSCMTASSLHHRITAGTWTALPYIQKHVRIV